MLDFMYCNPTKLMFGRSMEGRIGEEVAALPGSPKKALIVYGGGSAVRSGLLDLVRNSLAEAGLTVLAKGGVRPNPTVEFVRELIAFARAEGVDCLVAVGGGSCIDTAKAAAVGIPYEGDVWDFYCARAQVTRALPVAAVLTIPAAGSEQSIRSVISNGDVKTGIGSPLIRPRIAIINPERFFTIPEKFAAAGLFDMMSHILERYFTNTQNVDYTSGQAEAALRSIMRAARAIVRNPQDYDAWSAAGLAGSFAHNGYFGLGHVEDWACHGIEHALSGWRSEIIHGAGLAVVTPAWMRYVWKENPERFMRFGREVFGVDAADPADAIEETVKRLVAFLKDIRLPTTLSELTDEPVPVDEIARLATRAPLGNFKRLAAEDVVAILNLARGG
jgi:hypothetical protein